MHGKHGWENYRIKATKRYFTSGAGKAANFTASAVCRWEKNFRTPSDDDLVLIADFFGVTTEVLLGTEGVSESGTDNDISAKEKRDQLDRNKQKKRVVFFSVGIILIVVCILTVL